MLNKVIKQTIVILIFVISFIFLFTYKIEASYGSCIDRIEDTDLYDCGKEIYTFYEDKDHSSKIIAKGDDSILYAGKKEGYEIFYANGFEFYNVTYDDRSSRNNNIWSVLTTQGEMVFDGSFEDSIIIDESHSGYYMQFLYKEIYTIRQYINNGQLHRKIVIYNYHQGNIEFNDAKYDDIVIENNVVKEVLDPQKSFNVSMDSVYGIKSARVQINGNDVENVLRGKHLSISSEVLKNSMVKGEVNTISINVKDYFGKKKDIKYKLLLVNTEALIEFSTMTSVVESSSRRILINAKAGKGKTLDADYCWYYWSESPDDGLSYEDFLKNYALSEYKGSYSKDKGVILRNTSGTYYLYALAKDDDSTIIKRSEGYILTGEAYRVSYNVYDAIFIVSLLICAIIPISIYLYIRKKGY